MAGALVASSKGQNGRRQKRPPMADINVTPLVDVMLVLLIIFMVTAPLLTVGVPVDLPQTRAQVLAEQVEPLVITLNSEGEVFIQETPITLDGMVEKLQAITDNKLDTRIYVRADKGLNYGRVMEIMGLVSAAGFSKVALVAEMPPTTQ